MNEITDLIEEIGHINRRAKDLYKEYKDLQVTLAEKKHKLELLLNDAGLRSAKTDLYTVSIRQKRDIQVTHEQSVIDWLKNEPNVEYDAYIGLKLTPFKSFANGWWEQTGEIIDGTESIITESISIRENK